MMVRTHEHEEADDGQIVAKGITVVRDRLLRELDAQGRHAGVTFICAAEGMGKTALLLQYAARVRDDSSRGDVVLWSGSELDAERFAERLDRFAEKGARGHAPLLLIDDVPELGADGVKSVTERLRGLREKGVQVVMTCRPDGQTLMAAMGDSYKMGGRALLVTPQEYREWARAFSISNSLDVYGLTKGIPSLVAMLQVVTGKIKGRESLDRMSTAMYASAIKGFKRDRDPLYRIACLMVLLGSGNLSDLGRLGMRVKPETVDRLVRDYPIFGLGFDDRSFSCLDGGAPMARLRKQIADDRPDLALKAARILILSRREDRAVHLANEVMGPEGSVELISLYPTELALSGNARFVREVTSQIHGAEALDMRVGAALAIMLSSLVLGEYRPARAMCAELRRRAKEVEEGIPAAAWKRACAFVALWGSCTGMALPEMSPGYLQGAEADGEARLLECHREAYGEVLRRVEGIPLGLRGVIDGLMAKRDECGRLDIPRILLKCDCLLDDALHGSIDDPLRVDDELEGLVKTMYERGLKTIGARVRMTAAVCRLMNGLPSVDERAFVDAGTIAVRESDLPTQLFCLLGEGWQAIDVNQSVSARFRAQQVLKLIDGEQSMLFSWGTLLEQSSAVLNTPRIVLCDESDTLDLSQCAGTVAHMWAVALKLSAARHDSELSAWFSAHRDRMLEDSFRPLAAQALSAVGERADSIRMMLPERMARRYMRDGAGCMTRMYESERVREIDESVGQICVRLFGGFCVERNGHRLTDSVWKRKKASVLAARLVLAMGSFVSRKVITEELWPEAEYGKARSNLYVVASALRSALCQRENGPQYLVAQGDGLSMNDEFVTSDTARFDMLAHDVLLKRTGTSGRQIIEACLKMDELYVGPLYVPDVGDVSYFVHMRRVYLNKYLDCMMRGVDIAVEMDDLPSASWLVEAAMKQAPYREDVIRRAMDVYDKSGRRREVVELYASHLHYLEHELHSVPEEATRLAYESIITRAKAAEIL